MADSKTKPTKVNVETFLSSISEKRRQEAETLVRIMRQISGKDPVMWGPSIIGFGSQHYKYDTGREGDMPVLGFSPRKASITVYFEGFGNYTSLLQKLGKHKTSVSCLYINKLEDVDVDVLRQMLKESYERSADPLDKPATVEEYISRIPKAVRPKFDELRVIVKSTIPNANEVFSYGIVGYKIDEKRARVFISGFKDHVAIYPVPKDEALKSDLKQFVKGKGTLWFPLDESLPKKLIEKTVKALVK